MYHSKNIIKHLLKTIILISLLYTEASFAESATATQTIEIVIPKIALIDTDNTKKPIKMVFNPINNAGDNFATTKVTGFYDVTSNIPRLRLYAQTDSDLKENYNLSLKVLETKTSGYQVLGTDPVKVSTQGQQAQKMQPLYYQASPASPNQTIPYGDINVKVTYTLVEP